jgi:protocatechuate 3,4-dioxygenase beta subunit
MFFNRKPRSARPASRPPTRRLGLEALEDRTAPAVLVLDPSQTATVASPFGDKLSVLVTDAQGKPEAGIRVDYSVQPGASGAGAVLSASSAVTDANGIAAVPAAANHTSGTYTVTARAVGDPETALFSLTNQAGPAAVFTPVTGDHLTVASGHFVDTTLTVRVTDTFGNPVPGVPLLFEGAVSGQRTTDDFGEASSVLSNTIVEQVTPATITAEAVLRGGEEVAEFDWVVTATAPASLHVVSGSLHHSILGQPLAPLKVLVTDAAGNPVPGALVAFSVQAGAGGAGATLSSDFIFADDNGVATVNGTANGIAGPYTVTASLPGSAIPPVSFALDNLSSAPTAVTVVGGSGQSATVGTRFAAPLEVRVTDANGKPVAGAVVALAAQAGSNGADASLSAGLVTTDSLGLAAVTATANHSAGSFTVTANVPGLSLPNATFTLTNAPGRATQIVPVNQPASAPVGTAFTPLTFRAEDAFGNPVAGVRLTFAVHAGSNGASATLSAASAVTGADGTAGVTAAANHTAGTFSVTASSTSLSGASASLTSTPGAPASVALLGGSPQMTVASSAFAQPLSVLVTDAFGNPVPGAAVTFRVTSGLGVSLPTGPVVTDKNGVASVLARATGTADVSTVTATVAGVTGGASFELATTFSPVGGLGASGGTPQVAVVRHGFAAPLQVFVSDAFGNPLPDALVAFTVQAGTGGAGATLSSGLVASDASGFAAVQATANGVTGAYTVTATVLGTPFTATFHLTNLAVPAAVSVVQGSDQSARVGTAFTTPLVVRVTDAAGKPVAGVTVAFTFPSAARFPATVSSATATTGSDGTASVTVTANTRVGSYTLTAAVAGAGKVLFHLTNLAGPAVSLTVGGVPAATVGKAFAPLVFRAADAFGNPVAGVRLTFAVHSGTTGASATLSASSAITGADGTVTVTATAGTVAGSFTVAATSPGLPEADLTLTNAPGAPATLTRIAEAFGNAAVTFLFRVTDAFGNPVPGAAVTVTEVSGVPAVVTVATPRTSTNGAATFTVKATHQAGQVDLRIIVAGIQFDELFTLTASL